MITHTKKEECICCGSTDLFQLLDLNNQPLANSYHDGSEKLPEYPLGLNLCKNCYHLQLTHIVNPDLMFKDYLYVSGTSQTLRDYFNWFAEFTTRDRLKGGKILDIACNDGTQLDSFKKLGWQTYGIDPAENLYELSSKNHNITCDYFTSDQYDRQFDIITAQNVFAHNEEALKFLNDCADILNDSGTVYIQTSQAELIKSNQFDTVYHEHISFFNINSMNELAKRSNLNLVDVIKTPIHGISYVFVFKKDEYTTPQEINWVQNLINVEKERGLLKLETYLEYKENVENIIKEFVIALDTFRKKGYKIIGYGAAAKGMTFLNYAQEYPDIIIDDNPLKQGLLTPGGNTPIKSVEYLKELKNDDKILFIPLAWNFYNEIRSNIKKHRDNPNDIFLKYFPQVKTTL